VRLVFQDGTENTADLVIGADGIRSIGLPCLLTRI
jgi:2-polyprenyl-6-methoxyphenol hydroxylase-like FAD-dependent oxidoreductase